MDEGAITTNTCVDVAGSHEIVLFFILFLLQKTTTIDGNIVMTGFVLLAWLRAPARIFFLTGDMACAWGSRQEEFVWYTLLYL